MTIRCRGKVGVQSHSKAVRLVEQLCMRVGILDPCIVEQWGN